MDRIKNWSARRSGARMTITGTDAASGAPVRIADVDTINVTAGGIAAVKDQEVYLLEPSLDQAAA